MTFSRWEKVPMQRPRGAWVLHRRLRGKKAEGLRSFSRRRTLSWTLSLSKGSKGRRRRAAPDPELDPELVEGVEGDAPAGCAGT